MSNRRKNEGEEELQLQLLEVSQDPTFGKPAPQDNRWMYVRSQAQPDTSDKPRQQKIRVLH